MKFKVDRDMCQSAAVCIAFLTKENKPIYELDDESKAVIITKSGKKVSDKMVEVKDLDFSEKEKIEDLEKTVLESAKSCPFNAIIIEDDKGKQLWPES